VVITLQAKNPQAAQNIVRYDHTMGEYITIKLGETMIDHMEIESTVLHVESPEGRKQIQREGGVRQGKMKRVL
jgi:hypothetical protein